MNKIINLSILCLLSLNLFAEEKIKISLVGPEYSGLINADKTGIYQKIISQAFADTNYQINEDVLPAKRALLSFVNGESDCIYGMSKTSLINNKNIVQSKLINETKLYIFTKKGSSPIISFDKVPARVIIGGILGNDEYYNEFIKDDQKIEYAIKDEQNVAKLNHEYLKYIFGFLPNMQPFKNFLSYKEDKPLNKYPNSILCYKTEKNLKFIATFNKQLNKIDKNKILETNTNNAEALNNQIKLLKSELRSDLLPPPLFIIESHLFSYISLIDTNKEINFENNNPNIENIKNFESRVAYWNNHSTNEHTKNLWNAYKELSLPSAMEYLKIQEKEFIPALKNKQYSFAKKILDEKLTPLYKTHRKSINKVVSKALEEKKSIKNNFDQFLEIENLISDIIPPPMYAVETHLFLYELVLNDLEVNNLKQDKLVLLLGDLDKGKGNSQSYIDRYTYWKSLEQNTLKQEKAIYINMNKSHEDLKKYYKIITKTFFRALNKKDLVMARKILTNDLEPIYQDHKKTVASILSNCPM